MVWVQSSSLKIPCTYTLLGAGCTWAAVVTDPCTNSGFHLGCGSWICEDLNHGFLNTLCPSGSHLFVRDHQEHQLAELINFWNQSSDLRWNRICIEASSIYWVSMSHSVSLAQDLGLSQLFQWGLSGEALSGCIWSTVFGSEELHNLGWQENVKRV